MRGFCPSAPSQHLMPGLYTVGPVRHKWSRLSTSDTLPSDKEPPVLVLICRFSSCPLDSLNTPPTVPFESPYHMWPFSLPVSTCLCHLSTPPAPEDKQD
ncbi:hypothetical protein DPEC_G00353050 [Dallia pectoralis]|uniref:Uncharacterized protein n=1 Tax=Dallia pectoralis TaxID=75939 RepID=A0ACC2F2E7_DALPE|nr:hypothetical protein DPEC_G00353050 [Dallia pectoralis]